MINNTIRTVRLYGKLGAKFGRVHKLAVTSAAEAVRALCVTIPGFEKYMINSKENNLEFAVFSGKENLTQDILEMGGVKDIRIAPIVSGSKRNGLFQTILGVVLIAIAWWNPLGWAAGGALLSGTMAAGVGLAVGGVIQMLSPQPKGLKARESTENAPSQSFGGAVNTVATGQPLAILGGSRVIGGAIISASVVAEEYA